MCSLSGIGGVVGGSLQRSRRPHSHGFDRWRHRFYRISSSTRPRLQGTVRWSHLSNGRFFLVYTTHAGMAQFQRLHNSVDGSRHRHQRESRWWYRPDPRCMDLQDIRARRRLHDRSLGQRGTADVRGHRGSRPEGVLRLEEQAAQVVRREPRSPISMLQVVGPGAARGRCVFLRYIYVQSEPR